MAFINGDLFPSLKELSATGKWANRARVVKSVFEDAYNYMKDGQLIRQVVNKITEVNFNDLAERKHFGDIYEQMLGDLQAAGNAGEFYTPRAVTAFMVDRIDPKPGEIIMDPSCGTGGFLTCSIRHMRERYVKTVEDEAALQASLRAVELKQLPHMLCVTNMLLHGVEDASFVRHDNTLARPYVSYTNADRVDIILTNPPFGASVQDGIESNFPQHFRTRETADLFLALIIRLLKPNGRAAVMLPDGSLFGEGVKTRLKEHLMAECNLHTIVRLPNSVFKPYASIGTNLLFFKKGSPTQDIWFYEHRVPASQKAYSMTRPIRLEHLQGCVDWWGGAERAGRVETEVAWTVSADEVKARGYNSDFKNPHTVADDHGDLCTKTGSGSTPAGGKDAYVAAGVPFLRSQNVYDDGLRLDGVAFISDATQERMSSTAVKAGDLLLNITGGSIGRCAIVPDSFVVGNINQHVAIIRLALPESGCFLNSVIRSDYFQRHIFGNQTGAGREGLPKNRMDEIRIPVAPLAEQHRIVAKVDELMALCDQLEVQLTIIQTDRRRLLEAVLEAALAPA